MVNILVGTASWTDKALIDSGRFYPAQVKTPEQRLRYYSEQFPRVEVDSSYYALPSPAVAGHWVARTSANFVFDIKAFRLFTQHWTKPAVLPKDIREALGPQHTPHLYFRDVPAELRTELWARFRAALIPLQQAGKLGCVLLQYPPWFVANRANLGHIQACVDQLNLRRALQLSLLARGARSVGRVDPPTGSSGRYGARAVQQQPPGLRTTQRVPDGRASGLSANSGHRHGAGQVCKTDAAQSQRVALIGH